MNRDKRMRRCQTLVAALLFIPTAAMHAELVFVPKQRLWEGRGGWGYSTSTKTPSPDGSVR